MKSKVFVVLSTMLLALGMMAQTATQTAPQPANQAATQAAPPAAGDTVKTCACCNHDQADGKKMACCGKDAACCAGKDATCCKGGSCCQGKDGKSCPMMSKNQDGKMSCCAGGKCSMMSKNKSGKSCCGGKMCERPQAGA